MNDLAIELDLGSKEHIYEQIYNYIRDEIREGKLLLGEKLPSTRSLAEYLQVARSTVELAYEQLISEGYIESVPYKGYFVCEIEHLYKIDTAPEMIIPSGEQQTVYRYDFSPNGIETQLFPFSTWKRISGKTLSDSERDLFLSGNPQGEIELRETISRYIHSSRGVNCSPDQIIIGAGNDYLLMLLQKILGNEKRVVMESATYLRAAKIFKAGGYEVKSVDYDKNGMIVDKIHQMQADMAYVMPSHQYPTGIVMPIGRRMELLKWAVEAENRYLIEDDYDSEFRYKGKPVPSLQASDNNGKVIYIGTFSKSIAPAIRISFMVLPWKLIQVYQEQCGFYSSTVSRIDQMVLHEFIRDGYFERYLNKMRKIYKEKHEIMMGALKCLQDRFEVSGEDAGLHILLTAKRKEMTEEWLVKAAKETGVRVYGLSTAFLKEGSSSTVLLGFAGMKRGDIQKGIELLNQAWQ